MTQTILIADDDADIRRLLDGLFSGAGFSVLSARDGREALRLLIENGLPDVMVVDHNMPGKMGLDLIKEVRNREGDQHVAAILITGTHMRGSEDVRAALAHADLMLGKPFDYQQLLQMVQRLLSARI
ncbi:MAG: response regulator [Chloroflexota bacterium]